MNNRRLIIILAIVVTSMLGLCAAAVPLYAVFCKATGFAGTTQSFAKKPTSTGQKLVKIQFDSNIDPNLPWAFYATQREVIIRPGETALTYFYVENKSDQHIIGMAIFNVTPHLAGKYFNKIKCFCFEEQLLRKHDHMTMPVLFYLDPAIELDPETADISIITLSYTFFKIRDIDLT